MVKKKASVEAHDQPPPEDVAPVVPEQAPSADAGATTFPIVGIGASAGGLAAFEEFFARMPATTESGMAFVLIQHLDPSHESLLTELVARYAKMATYEVVDGLAVEPNCVYVIPPNKDMALVDGRLLLTEPSYARGLRLPIDHFYRSLAEDRHEQAICVILSGTGTDGTLGLREIKGQGGMAMAQDPDSAAHDGMPRSAIATGMVDYILPAGEMPDQLIAYVDHAFGTLAPKVPLPEVAAMGSLRRIFALVRGRTGHDFSAYRKNTVLRRIERRMAVHQILRMQDYVRYLEQSAQEVDTLFQEILIGVTSFFRDPDAFEVLTTQAIVPLLTGGQPDRPLRIWVPACATGEEAYSIAMIVHERAEMLSQGGSPQVFATDIDPAAIERGRAAVYPDSIAVDVTPERLASFFVAEKHSYRVRETIRNMVIFAVQNAIADPPFSHIDLISCRNLLIYLEPELQKELVSLFHYALNPGAFLFLGSSESVGSLEDHFDVVDRKWKLYRRKGTEVRYWSKPPFGLPTSLRSASSLPTELIGRPDKKPSVRDVAERVLLAQHTPASVFLRRDGEVVYFHGRTGRYLEPSTGDASLNIATMAREGLRLELVNAIRKVVTERAPVYRPALRVKTNGDYATVDLTVQLLTEPELEQELIMVIFDEVPVIPSDDGQDEGSTVADASASRVVSLEQELRAKEGYLQATVQELQTSNEELRSTNEELQSSMEELQSTNEELVTSREELQSINQELTTVNSELQQKISAYSRANNDMNNLLAGTGVGTVFVDEHLTIQRFTPAATEVIHLIPSDVGRPVSDIVANLDYPHLVEDTRAVLDTLIPREVAVCTPDGRWYLMRILPYRTTENVIEGAVLTFVDITELKAAQTRLEEQVQMTQDAHDYARAMVDTLRGPVLVLDADLTVVSVNAAFYALFGVRPEETIGQKIYALGNHQWDIPDLRRLLEEILPKTASIDDYRVDHEFEQIGRRSILLNAREVAQRVGGQRLILLAFEDVTGRE